MDAGESFEQICTIGDKSTAIGILLTSCGDFSDMKLCWFSERAMGIGPFG